MKVIRGVDGLCRSAILRTKNGTTSRPISKLYPLELISNVEDETSNGTGPILSRRAKCDAKEKIKRWIQPRCKTEKTF